MENNRVRVLVVPVTAPCRVEDVDRKLEEFQRLVGGPIEFLAVSPGLACYIDEEARIREPKRAPNSRATALVDMQRLMQRQETLTQPLLGDVVFFGVDGGQDELDVPYAFAFSTLAADKLIAKAMPGRAMDYATERRVEESPLVMGVLEDLGLTKPDPSVRPEEKN
jgi:hypothetical protein